MGSDRQQMEKRRVLPIYGTRGTWMDKDSSERVSSVMRGYASLNGEINMLMKRNPGMIVHSVSHATTVFPPEKSGYIAIMQSATILYSGQINDVESVRTDRKHIDDTPSYGTIIKMEL